MNELSKTVSHLVSSPFGGGQVGAVYFIGIGGIGMSAIARYFNAKGVRVSGYDKTETVLTKQLVAEGIAVHYEDNIEFIDKKASVVVYTPAVPKDHKELNWCIGNDYTVVKRSDILGAITSSAFNICVAGTHGKTTTSTMVAHILRHSGFGCNAFLGGIAANYGSNFWPAPKNAGSSANNVCVVEADEYDRSFLKLNPDVAIITAMDPDHLDIYGTAENVEQAFIDFSAKVKADGLLVSKYGLKRGNELKATHHVSYHLQNENADVYAASIKTNNGSYVFDVKAKDWELKGLELHMGGLHNIENVTAAITVAHHLKIDDEKIKAAVSSFKGVKRRFEYIVKNEKVVFIDDYAHHPDELKALLISAKDLFPGRLINVVFQPHLFSRTKDFADGFAEALNLADEVYLLPIYPAREQPMEGVTSELILKKMDQGKGYIYESKEELLDWIKYAYYDYGRNDFLITAGAGDIDTLVEPIKTILTKHD